MSGWQSTERSNKVPNVRIGSMYAGPSAEILQHIDAGPSVRRIHHEMHRPVRFEHAAQRSESRIRVRKMVKNPGAHDLVEVRLQIIYTLDRQFADAEVVPAVFSFNILGTPPPLSPTPIPPTQAPGPPHPSLSALTVPPPAI